MQLLKINDMYSFNYSQLTLSSIELLNVKHDSTHSEEIVQEKCNNYTDIYIYVNIQSQPDENTPS